MKMNNLMYGIIGFFLVAASGVFADDVTPVPGFFPHFKIIVDNIQMYEPVNVEVKPANYDKSIWDGHCSDEVPSQTKKAICTDIPTLRFGIPAFPASYANPTGAGTAFRLLIEKAHPSFDGEIILSKNGQQIADLHYSLNFHLPNYILHSSTRKYASSDPTYYPAAFGKSWLQWNYLKNVSQDPAYIITTDHFYPTHWNWCYMDEPIKDPINTPCSVTVVIKVSENPITVQPGVV